MAEKGVEIEKIRAALLLIVEKDYSIRSAAAESGVRINTVHKYYTSHRPANRHDVQQIQPFKMGRPSYLGEEDEEAIKIVAQSFDAANLPLTLQDLGVTMLDLKRRRDDGENTQNEEDRAANEREEDAISPPAYASVRRLGKRIGLKFRRARHTHEGDMMRQTKCNPQNLSSYFIELSKEYALFSPAADKFQVFVCYLVDLLENIT